ncbi:MAG TPA: hypothetical protein VH394_24685 [Thermoanaerobaculia bacterium]|jgi:hypothetical protein|nr:hypothetical protein [Thermoanaerobaculia bacterium]
MKIPVLLIVLTLTFLSAGAALAQSPETAPQAQTLEQIRLSIFQAGPSAAGAADPIRALSPEPQAATCSGDFCQVFLCECAQQCQPCGVARANCVAFLCACKQC